MMPKLDGFSLAEKITKIHLEIPFLFLTVKMLKENKIKGLQLGADDYIVKPFEADELVLRLNNILKRSKINSSLEPICNDILIGIFTLNINRSELVYNNKIQKLTQKEADLLHYLYENKNQLLKRKDILNKI